MSDEKEGDEKDGDGWIAWKAEERGGA